MLAFDDVKQQRVAPVLSEGVVCVGERGLSIDLGCGKHVTPGHIGFDCDPDADADFFCDLNKGIPLEDDSCVRVVAGHFLEHCADPEFMVYEMWRVCDVGGRVNINVPAVSWDSAFAIEHTQFISEHFFKQNRAFNALFDIDRMFYQYSAEALAVARKYIPEITEEDAGLLFTNVRRQLLVDATPKPEAKGENEDGQQQPPVADRRSLS